MQMRHTKSIAITIAIAALVVLTSISFSDASQSLIKHRVEGKYKHALIKHKVKGRHLNALSQAFANSEMKKEMRGSPADNMSWFASHEDPATHSIPDGLGESWYEHDHMQGALTTSSLLDTVACLGPFNQGGRTRGLLVSAQGDNIFFAGSSGGGLWTSTNSGSNWTPVNDSAANLDVTGITQSPFDWHNIYYATGEVAYTTGDGVGPQRPGDGIFKSTDGGIHFNHVGGTGFFPTRTWAIAHSQIDANTVYVGTSQYGLWRTTDGGSTWNRDTITGAINGDVGDIITFASGYGAGAVLLSKNADGIYYSPTGNPNTFTKISSAAFPTGFNQLVKLANCKNSPNVVYAAFAKAGGLYGICKSTDGGSTWAALTIPTITDTYSSYTLMLAVDPNNSNKVICAGVQGQYSTDGGISWGWYSDPLWDHHAYATSSGSSNIVLMGGDDGVVLGSWGVNSGGVDSIEYYLAIKNNNYVTTQFYGGNFASSGRRCLGGTQDNGTFLIKPSGPTGIHGDDGGWAHISQQDSTLGYFSRQSELGPPLYKTNHLFNDASQWDTNVVVGSGDGLSNYTFYQSNYADGYQVYFRTNKGVWRTIDAADHWTRLNPTGDDIQGIQYIGCTNAANPSIYFTTHGVAPADSFYRITNAKTYTPGIPTNLSASIPSTPTGVRTASFGEISQTPSGGLSTSLFMCITNYSSSIPHVYKVTNANTSTPTWTNISGDLPSTLAVNEVQADPLNSSDIFAATDFGLYYTTNGGTNWNKDYGIPNVSIHEMQLRSTDRKLFLFTYGRGVWDCSMAAIGGIVQQASVDPTPSINAFQFSVYPTPAASKLNITLKNELSSSARMVIYDMTGHMVSGNLWNAAGGESQEADISKLASGVYFLQIQDGDKMSTQKFEKM
jgi:hypothetical protein